MYIYASTTTYMASYRLTYLIMKTTCSAMSAMSQFYNVVYYNFIKQKIALYH